jgi:hypothetical protein
VQRKPDPTDGRARLVVPSAHGRKLRDIAQGEVTKVHAEWRKHLGTKEYDQLAATLAKLRKVTDPYRCYCAHTLANWTTTGAKWQMRANRGGVGS